MKDHRDEEGGACSPRHAAAVGSADGGSVRRFLQEGEQNRIEMYAGKWDGATNADPSPSMRRRLRILAFLETKNALKTRGAESHEKQEPEHRTLWNSVLFLCPFS